MRITLNDEPVEADEGSSISSVLALRGIPLENSAVERNGEIVERDRLGDAVQDGDRIIIVRFVGGG
ncbi:MAG: sulfur carrier protein ThiS [Deltaproteobacteria bacterium]|nr:sulfur carrier protein ThiS [Deltaproteobacteria bacterium]